MILLTRSCILYINTPYCTIQSCWNVMRPLFSKMCLKQIWKAIKCAQISCGKELIDESYSQCKMYRWTQLDRQLGLRRWGKESFIFFSHFNYIYLKILKKRIYLNKVNIKIRNFSFIVKHLYQITRYSVSFMTYFLIIPTIIVLHKATFFRMIIIISITRASYC